MEFYKAIYPYFPERNYSLTDNAVADVLNGVHLFSFDMQSSGLYDHAPYFRTHEATPKVFPIPNLYGCLLYTSISCIWIKRMSANKTPEARPTGRSG